MNNQEFTINKTLPTRQNELPELPGHSEPYHACDVRGEIGNEHISVSVESNVILRRIEA